MCHTRDPPNSFCVQTSNSKICGKPEHLVISRISLIYYPLPGEKVFSNMLEFMSCLSLPAGEDRFQVPVADRNLKLGHLLVTHCICEGHRKVSGLRDHARSLGGNLKGSYCAMFFNWFVTLKIKIY